MQYPVDDSIYNVDSVWLGPPGKALPWRARYVAYAVGFFVFIGVQIVERRLGIAISFFALAWGLLATVAITRALLSLVDHDRPLIAVLVSIGNEISAPRPDVRARTAVIVPGRVRVRADVATRRGGLRHLQLKLDQGASSVSLKARVVPGRMHHALRSALVAGGNGFAQLLRRTVELARAVGSGPASRWVGRAVHRLSTPETAAATASGPALVLTKPAPQRSPQHSPRAVPAGTASGARIHVSAPPPRDPRLRYTATGLPMYPDRGALREEPAPTRRIRLLGGRRTPEETPA